MNTLAIAPISHAPAATVAVPGSKSLTNRALAAAALAEGVTRLVNPLIADDTRYFIEALLRLGFRVESRPDGVVVHGLGGRIPAQWAELFVGNAGTAARFLTALVTLGAGEYVIRGDARMHERPIADLLKALRALGAEVESVNGAGCPPVRVRASGLRGGRAAVPGDTSSQYLSALLLAAPYASVPVELVVERGLNSRPFVDMTLAVMADFGVAVERDEYQRFRVRPARYRPCAEYVVESDASAASYFFAAPAILGGWVKVQNIGRKSRQGDLRFLDVLAEMGCEVQIGDDRVEVRGPRGPLRGVEVDLRDMPDTAMTLAAIAPFATTPTAIRGIASSRVKETDRVAAMCAELARLGVPASELPDGLIIQPCQNIRPAVIQTYGDHRMAMAFALVGLRVAGLQIADPGCVSKTFPDYFEVLERLR